MTEQKPPPVRVAAEAGSRLAQLHAERATLAPAVKAGTERLKEINDAIKVELVTARPDADEMVLTTPGVEKGLRLYAKATSRFDSTRFKADHPDTHEAYTNRGVAWELREQT